MFEISASDTDSVLLFAGLRFLLAGILVITFGSIIERRVLLPKKSSLWKILLLCLAQTVVQYAFFYVGLSRTTGVKASIIEAMNVFVAIVVAAFIFRQEKFTFLKAVGCMLGMAGIVVVNLNGLSFEASLTGGRFYFYLHRVLCFFRLYVETFFKIGRYVCFKRISIFFRRYYFKRCRFGFRRETYCIFFCCGRDASLSRIDIVCRVYAVGRFIKV